MVNDLAHMLEIPTVDDNFVITSDIIQHLLDNQYKDIVISTEHYDLNAVGLYKLLDCFVFNSVTIYTWNVLESHSKYTIKLHDTKFYMFYERSCWADWIVTNEDLEWDSSYRFITLFGRPTKYRLMLAGYLHTHYLEQTNLFFAADPTIQSIRHQFDLSGMFNVRYESLNEVAALIPKLPLVPTDGFYDQSRWREDNAYLKEYKHALIDIVVEPNLVGIVLNPTEKVTRPMLLKKPFIVMGSMHLLHYLKLMGFRTFSDFWDESYDMNDGPDRLHKILLIIDKIAKMSQSELLAMYQAMQPVLEHNRELLLSSKFNTNIGMSYV